MTITHAALLIASLIGAAGAKKSKAEDVATGALTFLVSRACEQSGSSETSLEWRAFAYDYSKRSTVWKSRTVSRCYIATVALTAATATGVLWAQKGEQSFETDSSPLFNQSSTWAAFESEFGWRLPDHNDLAGNSFVTYKAKKLQALFNRLYLEPSAKVGDAGAQTIYDVVFKTFLTRFARDVAFLNQHIPKKDWAKLLKRYRAAANEKGDGFYGPSFLRELAREILPEDDQGTTARTGRTLGIVLRRRADGTWNTVSKLLKKVLKDYDPALAKELRGKL